MTTLSCRRPRSSRSTQKPAGRREIAGRKMDAYNRWMEVMVPVTMSGCPAVNVPAGFNAAGLPMGLQIMAPNHAERSCLELAYAYDQATRWVERRPPPMLTSVH